jgi:hypothetical protein
LLARGRALGMTLLLWLSLVLGHAATVFTH